MSPPLGAESGDHMIPLKIGRCPPLSRTNTSSFDVITNFTEIWTGIKKSRERRGITKIIYFQNQFQIHAAFISNMFDSREKVA